MDVNIKIRKRRLELGYKSARKFAEYNNINRSTYEKIERGNDLKISTLYRIAKLLQIEPKELL